MAYNNNVPQAGQRIKDTQQPINDNFAAIDTLIAVNHEAFNTADAGKHKFVTLTNQGAAPVGAANEWNIYNILNGGVQELTLRKAGGVEIPITKYAGGGSGYTYLPSGMILKWGEGTVNGNGSLNFSTPFPSSCYQVVATIQNPNAGDIDASVRVVSWTVNGATFYVSKRTTTGTSSQVISYFAIGI